jgi:UDP-N-acetylglucosamine--N-acetylmuramyl-(pentapeptide) pyrophosphoryl-undecaprenol N-acetylglucosamine transferase
MKNARAMEAAGGAIVLPQADLSGMKLVEMIVAILSNPTRLSAMQSKSLEMRRIDAGEVIVNECYALMGVPHDINQSKKTAGG